MVTFMPCYEANWAWKEPKTSSLDSPFHSSALRVLRSAAAAVLAVRANAGPEHVPRCGEQSKMLKWESKPWFGTRIQSSKQLTGQTPNASYGDRQRAAVPQREAGQLPSVYFCCCIPFLTGVIAAAGTKTLPQSHGMPYAKRMRNTEPLLGLAPEDRRNLS